MASVRVRYTTTHASLLDGMKASSDFPRFALQQALWGFLLLFLMGLFLGTWATAAKMLMWLKVSALLAVGNAAVWTALTAFVTQPLNARRYYRSNPLEFGDMELEADDVGLNVRAPRSESAHAWGELRGFKETRNVFLIARSKTTAFAIPKGGMEPATQTALREVLQANLRRLPVRGLG